MTGHCSRGDLLYFGDVMASHGHIFRSSPLIPSWSRGSVAELFGEEVAGVDNPRYVFYCGQAEVMCPDALDVIEFYFMNVK